MNRDPYALATLSSEGAPPKSRLTDARQALQLFQTLKRSGEKRASKAAVIQGMRDGNPPYDGLKLRNRNEAWRGNFSDQQGPSRIDAAKTPFYNLITSAQIYAECRTTTESETVDAATATRIRGEEFDAMLRSFEDFEDEWWLLFDDMVCYNRGFFFFPEPDSWKFEHVAWNRVYFPEATSVKRGKWNFFAIEHSWTVHELWKRARSGPGWNQKAVFAAIRNAVPDTVARTDDPMSVQKALADQELYASECSEMIRAASVFVQEFDGSWSWMVVADDSGTQAASTAPTEPQSMVDQSTRSSPGTQGMGRSEKDWLYRRERVAERVTQIIVPFFYETGSGSVNSLKGGLGARILPIMQMNDRMACALSDGVMLRNSIVLQPQSAGARSKTGLVQLGAITSLPEGFEVHQGTIFGDLEGSIAVRTHFAQTVDTTTGTFRPQFEKPTGNPEPVGTAQLRFAQAAQLSDSAVERFYKRADTFYYELYKRAADSTLPDSKDPFIKAAREFQRRCRERGLTERQIGDCVKGAIRASRTIGNGSPAMRQQLIADVSLLALQGLLGPRGMRAWKTMYVASRLGQVGVQALLPPEDEAQVPTRDDWDASQENADMNQGNQVVFAGWQDHRIHAMSHIQAGFAAVQAVQQGADPASAFTFLSIALPHTAQHVASSAPEPIRKQLGEMLKELEKQARAVEQAAQEQLRQRQRQQQLTFDQQVKLQEVQAKLAQSEQKMQGTMQLKAERQAMEMQLKAQAQGTQTQLADASTAAGIQRETAATAASIENERQRTEAAIETERRKAEAQAAAAKKKPKEKK